MNVGILTFHSTPNFGATLQCYALCRYLQRQGADVEIINYLPPHNLAQYARSLFLGKRRGWANLARCKSFIEFAWRELPLSGPPVFDRAGLRTLATRYDAAIVGSDEVWKVDHMRKLDPSFYLDFADQRTTRTVSYAASASSSTQLAEHAATVQPLLDRFDAVAVRDRHTAEMVQALVTRPPTMVVDPTFLWDFGSEALPRMVDGPYLAVYSWLKDAEMDHVVAVAQQHGLQVVCVGCRSPRAHLNLLGIGPRQWLQLIRHASFVVTDFFHGIVFSMLFRKPFFAHVDAAKRMKMHEVLALAGLEALLHDRVTELSSLTLDIDYDAVEARLAEPIARSKAFLFEAVLNQVPRIARAPRATPQPAFDAQR